MNLHGILAELGIENPLMHADPHVVGASQWILDETFEPVIGNRYEIAFGKVVGDLDAKPLIKRVRIDGVLPEDWFDLEQGEPLPAALAKMPVKAFRPLESA